MASEFEFSGGMFRDRRLNMAGFQQTNMAMLFAFAGGKFESFNKCVGLSSEEITGNGSFGIGLTTELQK